MQPADVTAFLAMASALPDDGPSADRVLETAPRRRPAGACTAMRGRRPTLPRGRRRRRRARPTRAEREQALSGICSARCFALLNGPECFAVDEWLGQGAQATQLFAAPGGLGAGFLAVHVVERPDGALETRVVATGAARAAAAEA
jgi:hypothetical protein